MIPTGLTVCPSWPLSYCKPLRLRQPTVLNWLSRGIYIRAQVVFKWEGRSKASEWIIMGLGSTAFQPQKVSHILVLRGEPFWRVTQIYNRRCMVAVWLRPVTCSKIKSYYKLSLFCMCFRLYRCQFHLSQQPFPLLDDSHSTDVNSLHFHQACWVSNPELLVFLNSWRHSVCCYITNWNFSPCCQLDFNQLSQNSQSFPFGGSHSPLYLPARALSVVSSLPLLHWNGLFICLYLLPDSELLKGGASDLFILFLC